MLSCWPPSSDWVEDGRGPSEEPQLDDGPEPHLLSLAADGRGPVGLPKAAEASPTSEAGAMHFGRQHIQRAESKDDEDEDAKSKAANPKLYQIQMPDLGTGDLEDILHAVVWHVGRHFGFQGESCEGGQLLFPHFCCPADITNSLAPTQPSI